MSIAPAVIGTGKATETQGDVPGRLRLSAFMAICAGLFGCVAPETAISYRDVSAPIAATTRFDPVRFAGTYRVVAAFAEGPVVPAFETVRYDWDGVARFTYFEVSPDASADLQGVAPVFRVVAPGRMVAGDLQHWVLWVDADYRTVAIGTPSGRFGHILEREDRISPDRMAAAREIFDWFGYDMTKLRKVQK